MSSNDIKTLVGKMTLKEKVGQITQILYQGEEPEEFYKVIDKIMPGSLILAGSSLAGSEQQRKVQREKIEKLQKYAMQKSGIPILFGRDVIHGHKVAFPVPLTMTASFDFDLIEKCFDAVREEATADGVNWTFSPMLDVARDPRWGRIVEGTGEDPYLGECYARAAVKGFQKNENAADGAMLACAKHFVGYGASEGGRDYNHTEISDYSLQNYYLPAFRAAAQCGVATVMSSFNDINCIPTNGSRKIMTDILRDQLKFSGFVVSDWDAIVQMAKCAGFASDKKDCAKKALEAGVDMDMVCNCYLENVEELVKNGELEEDILNTAVERILTVKARFGLFENPVYGENRYDLSKHLELAQKIASESLVLLKNDNNILPLSKSAKISLTGPFAEETLSFAGTWSLDFAPELINSIKTAFQNAGADFITADTLRQAAIFGADCIVLCLGEDRSMTGEAASVEDIGIPEEQIALIKKVKKLGLPVIGVLCFARPIIMEDNADLFDAIIYAGHTGTRAAEAIVSLIFGETEPEGRLPFTLPKYKGQIPLYYNAAPGSRFINAYYDNVDPYIAPYIDCSAKPLYPFGFGLSYSEFEYSEISSGNTEYSYDDIINGKTAEFGVKIKNIGKRRGVAVPQIYIHDILGSRIRPLRQLRGVKKVALESGEETAVSFSLGLKDFGFYLENGAFILEKGDFDIYIGDSSICKNKMWISIK